MSPMYSKMHDYLGYIIVLIDITKEAEVDRLKNDFISNVSHELRTPVTILSSYADTLYNYGSEFNYEEQKEFIGTINEEVIRLNKMVNDILDFSRMQSDRELEKEKQDLTATIEKIAQSHKILADEKSISISFIKEDNLPLISYNTQSIERVMSNLITNAIKYSPNDSRIKIRAEIARDPDYIEVTVEDNGIGISSEHQKMIFERFYRIENQVHTIKGTGLGLHLVKVAIEKHHQGKVFVHSKLNEGSTFGFWLPIDKSENKEEEKLQTPKDFIKEDIENYKIEKIEDYSKKLAHDAEVVGLDINEIQQEEETLQTDSQEPELKEPKPQEPIVEVSDNPIKEETAEQNIEPKEKEEDWEISFEVRD